MTATMLGMTDRPRTEEEQTQLAALKRIMRDIRAASDVLSDDEARYLVDTYYQVQEFRKATANQIRSMHATGEPNDFIQWLEFMIEYVEGQIKLGLNRYTNKHPMGVWAKSIVGIGPVIAAGLIAHIDITRSPSVSSLWRYSGYDPTCKWLGKQGARDAVAAILDGDDELVNNGNVAFEDQLVTLEELDLLTEGRNVLQYVDIVRIANLTNRKPQFLAQQAMTEAGAVTRTSIINALARRPWNANLKTLLWKVGDSFNKVQNNDNDVYGHLLVERKLYEWKNNIAGAYADQARERAETVSRSTEAFAWYSGNYRLQDGDEDHALAGVEVLKRVLSDRSASAGSGVPMLPPAHIQMRAQRWAVKLFLSHWHAVAYYLEYGKLSPEPYARVMLDHADEIPPPNVDQVPGLAEAYVDAGRSQWLHQVASYGPDGKWHPRPKAA